jgi:hypothetical protein
MSLLVVPVLPRARFISGLFITGVSITIPLPLSVTLSLIYSNCVQFLTCLAAALSLLFMWISTKARENTTHIDREATSNGPVPGARVVTYNAAASANQAVWFFFLLWAYNTYAHATITKFISVDSRNRFRAFRPQYFLPLIVFGIFLNITATYGCILPTLEHVYTLSNTHFRMCPTETNNIV